MITSVDLLFRSDASDEHRRLGVVAIEYPGPRLAPYQDIAFCLGSRRVAARITSIHRQGDHLPHVYVDEIRADELVS